MAVMNIGDIPSGVWRGEVLTHASLASDGASAAYGVSTAAQRFRAPQACVILGAQWEPTGASQAATVSDSYRRFTIYNASTDGAGTAVLGSLNLSATLATNATRAFTMQTATSLLTVPAGAIVAVSQTTVGGNHNGGTIVVAGAVHIFFRPL